MKTKQEITAKLADLRLQEAQLREELAAIERQTLVRCQMHARGGGCGRAFHIGDLVYIQTYWYTEPYGCTDGDYWNAGEGQFECPACGLRNRLYDRKDIEGQRHLFFAIVSSHSRKDGMKEIDKSHRRRFEERMVASRKRIALDKEV